MRREDKILKLVKEADPIDPVGYVRRIVSDYALENSEITLLNARIVLFIAD